MLVWVPWLGEEGDAVDVDVVVAKRGIAVRRIIEVDDEIFRVMARHPQQVWTSAQLSLDRSPKIAASGLLYSCMLGSLEFSETNHLVN